MLISKYLGNNVTQLEMFLHCGAGFGSIQEFPLDPDPDYT